MTAQPANTYLLTRLMELRDKIDATDRRVLADVNHRAKLVRQIQAVKAELGMSRIDETREVQLTRYLLSLNRGPLTDESVRMLMETIRDLTMPPGSP